MIIITAAIQELHVRVEGARPRGRPTNNWTLDNEKWTNKSLSLHVYEPPRQKGVGKIAALTECLNGLKTGK